MENIAPGPFQQRGHLIQALERGQWYVIGRCNGVRLTRESQIAHARLFAQAQELLEALEWALPIAKSAALLHPAVQQRPEALREVLKRIEAGEAAIRAAKGV